DPLVVLGPVRKPVLVYLRSEQFRQRGADSLLPRALAREVDIGVHGKTHTRQNVLERGDLLPGYATRDTELDPGFYASLLIVRAVMVDDALDPLPAHLAVRTIGQDRGILEGDIDLVVEPVSDPAANLFGVQPAGIHRHVERVMYVITRALLPQPLLELFS